MTLREEMTARLDEVIELVGVVLTLEDREIVRELRALVGLILIQGNITGGYDWQ